VGREYSTVDSVAVDRSVVGGRLPDIARLKRLWVYLGPAFIVSVAYVDPGNFATNISGGSYFNYNLLWVILWSNLMAILLQNLSAKLGIVTGRTLPENCGLLFSRPVNWCLWAVAEVAAMATDLAEFLGAALGLYLLFHVPMLWAGLLTGVITFLLLGLERYGYRAVESTIAAMVALISVAYIFEVFIARPDWPQVAIHTVLPAMSAESTMVAVGMLGATVMPHVIYLHSALVLPRRRSSNEGELRKHLRMEKVDITLAMNIAFLINASMVVVSAAVFHSNGFAIESIEEAHKTLAPLLGGLSSMVFGIALLASGLSSSVVGTMAGQVIMSGFVGLKMSLWLRRLVTMMPALIVIMLGLNPLNILIISQVALSFALPAAVIPLILITGRKDVMGPFTNSCWLKLGGWLVVFLIIALNGVLLCRTFIF
jgi:manganese transport protein